VALRLATKTNAAVVLAGTHQPSGDFVYIVTQDMTAEVRPVTAGIRLDEEIEVEKGVRAAKRW
jgi:hypothetical protein